MSNSKYCRRNCSTCQNIGSFNKLGYDNCAYEKRLEESTSPLMYQMARHKFEHCDRCTFDGVQRAPFDLVREESELRGLTRPSTRCPSKLYNPNCKKSDTCWSTFAEDVPAVAPANLCPVVCNNIKRQTSPGYMLRKQQWGHCNK